MISLISFLNKLKIRAKNNSKLILGDSLFRCPAPCIKNGFGFVSEVSISSVYK